MIKLFQRVNSINKKNKNYGNGSYFFNSFELASECSSCVNEYELDERELHVLDLTTSDTNILDLLSVLVSNRLIPFKNELMEEVYSYLMKYHYVDTSNYDVIISYKMDDYNFRSVRDFLENTISYEALVRLLNMNKDRVEYVLKTNKAIKQIKLISSTEINLEESNIKYLEKSNEYYKNYLEVTKLDLLKDTFIVDILRKCE